MSEKPATDAPAPASMANLPGRVAEVAPVHWYNIAARVRYAMILGCASAGPPHRDDRGRVIAHPHPWWAVVALPVSLGLTYMGRCHTYRDGGVTVGRIGVPRIAGNVVGLVVPLMPLALTMLVPAIVTAASKAWAVWLGLAFGVYGWRTVTTRRARGHRSLSWSARQAAAKEAEVDISRVLDVGNLAANTGTGGLHFAQRVINRYVQRGYVLVFATAQPALAKIYAAAAKPIRDHEGCYALWAPSRVSKSRVTRWWSRLTPQVIGVVILALVVAALATTILNWLLRGEPFSFRPGAGEKPVNPQGCRLVQGGVVHRARLVRGA